MEAIKKNRASSRLLIDPWVPSSITTLEDKVRNHVVVQKRKKRGERGKKDLASYGRRREHVG
jgi:hypothetical protein